MALACLRFSSDVLLRWRLALEAVLGAPTRACGSVLDDEFAKIAASWFAELFSCGADVFRLALPLEAIGP